jgi:hypothetical protein
MKLKGRENYPA